ncbi:MAG: DUF2911 domain-containing protein [Chitinophagaceae bacterium]|nr:DUF2911 domain-containing protein [Chitinophagaceae bacterium]
MNKVKLIGTCFLGIVLFSCNNSAEPPKPPPEDTAKLEQNDTVDVVANNPYYTSPDRSPMDMVYFPLDYPKLKMANGKLVARPLIRVVYSRPHLSRRNFSEILAYGVPWRLGANESTEIEFFRDVKIDGKSLKQGRYILYCIPQENEWTIVINSNTDTWGLQQDTTADVQRVVVPVTRENPRLEFFTITFENSENGANLVLAWDDVVAKLGIDVR